MAIKLIELNVLMLFFCNYSKCIVSDGICHTNQIGWFCWHFPRDFRSKKSREATLFFLLLCEENLNAPLMFSYFPVHM